MRGGGSGSSGRRRPGPEGVRARSPLQSSGRGACVLPHQNSKEQTELPAAPELRVGLSVRAAVIHPAPPAVHRSSLAAMVQVIDWSSNTNFYSRGMWHVYFACFIGFFNAVVNGYDLSIFNNLATFYSFGTAFAGIPDFQTSSDRYALTSAILQIGSIVGCLFGGFSSDFFGRRGTMLSGSLVIIVGVILELATTNLNVFMIGRFIVGFGIVQITTSAPIYIVEIAHPQFRSRAGAVYNTGWYVGAIPATVILFAMSYVDTTPLSWQLPVAIQALFSGVVLTGCFFIPESPRWLMDKGRDEEVRRFLVHYHGNEIEDHPIVEFTLNEMREALEDARRQNTASYMAFFTSIPMLYRTGLLIAVAFFSQYAGSWFASGFNVIVNSQFGFSSPQQQLGLSIVTAILNFVSAQIGASYVERIGRRPMLIYGSMSYVVCWIVILICLQIFNNDNSQTAVGIFGWVVVQIFSILYSFTWTPLNALYPVEILPYSARAKGMAFCQLIINAASVIQNWVLIYGVNSYGWKWDAFYCVFNVFAAFIIHMYFVETKGYTLEKIEDIFNDPNPVKKSLSEIRQVVSADTHVPRTKQYQYDPSTTLYIKYQ
ncbi:hypothetical protein HDU83_006882 [Entophlyctis luteolus]|nr:hypothetical protein HDU83_006882 [Entophlyctis luteolus]